MNEIVTNTSSQMQLPPIKPTSTVKLHSYLCRLEGEEYIVGRPELSVYISVPPIGVEIMQLLDQGLTVNEVAHHLQSDDEEIYDIIDFVQTLVEYGLVAEIDGRPIEVSVVEQEKGEGVELFAWLRPEHVGWLFSKPAWVLHTAVLVVVILLLWRYPQHLPQSDDFFFHPWYGLNTLIMMGMAWVLIFIHELGHLCAARAMGLRGRLGLSRRLYFVVAQFDIGNAWKLPRNQRMIIYAAGMLTNLWGFLLALVLVIWQGEALSSPIYAFLKLILILEWYAIAWQFLFYMQTDVYFLFADLFYARNLMGDARTFISNLFSRLLPQRYDHHDLSHLPTRERRFVQVYALFYIVGVGVAIALFFVYILPFTVKTTVGAIAVLLQGSNAGIVRSVDSIVILFSFAVNFGLLGWIWWREQVTNRQRQLTSTEPAK